MSASYKYYRCRPLFHFLTCPITMKSRGFAITIHLPMEGRPGNMTRDAALALFRSLESSCSFIIAGEEVSDAKGLHLQCYVYFDNPRSWKAVKKLFGTSHTEIARSGPDVNAKYCSKDGNVIYRFGNPPRPGARTDWDEAKQFIASGATLNETRYEFAALVSQGLDTVYRAAHAMKEEKEAREDLTYEIPDIGWEHDLRVQLEGPVDPRKIIWRYDTKGGAGKSRFAAWARFNLGAAVYRTCKVCDVAYAYEYEPVVIFDLPRAYEMNAALYSMLEMFSDGILFSGKYQSCTKMFKRPHRVVFANFPPERERMSADRWDIVDITPRTETEEIVARAARSSQRVFM